MIKIKDYLAQHNYFLAVLSCMSISIARVAANSKCMYIFHDPEKPAYLEKLEKLRK